MAYLSTIDCA
jgi:hypothetical protein